MHHQFFSETHKPDENRLVGDFVSRGIWGEPGRFRDFCTMAVTDSRGVLIGAAVYHNWMPDEGVVEVSSFSTHRNWMSKAIIRAAFSMPFDTLACQAVVARYSSEAGHVRKFWRALGSDEFVLPRLRGKHEPPEVVAILSDDAWRASKWMQEKKVMCHG